jgi:hypothetical protein
MMVPASQADVQLAVAAAVFLATALAAFIRRVFLYYRNGQPMTDVNPSDEELFFALSNPELVRPEVTRAVSDNHAGPSPTAQSAIFVPARRREHEDVAPGLPFHGDFPAPDRPPTPSPVSAGFRERVERHNREDDPRDDPRNDPRNDRLVSPRDDRLVSPPPPDIVPTHDNGPADLGDLGDVPFSPGRRDHHRDDRSRGDRDHERDHDRNRDRNRDNHHEGGSHGGGSHGRHQDDGESGLYGEDLVLEKQSVLGDLERLRLSGAHLSRQYVLSDRLEDMRFEIQKHVVAADEQQKVSMMKAGLEAAIKGTEYSNRQLGPFLPLDGWADDITADMSKFDDPLARIYRKYWRRSSMSPEAEIAWTIVQSLGWYSLKNWNSGPKAQTVEAAAPSMHVSEGLPPEHAVAQETAPAQRKMAMPVFDD